MLRLLWVIAMVHAGWSVAEVVSTDSERYGLILDRNPFSLKDPPPPAPVAAPKFTNPPPVKVNLKVSGISVTPDGKHAWFVVPPNPGKNTNELYWKIEEGGEQGEIKVIAISQPDGTVTVENAGERVVLSLENDSPAPAAASGGEVGGAVPRPGAPIVPTRGARRAIPVPTRPGLPGGALRSLNPRAPNSAQRAGSGDTGSASARSVSVNSGGNAFSRTVPTRPVRTAPEQDAPEIDPILQRLLLEEQTREAEEQGFPMPPVPPMPGGTE